MYFFVIFLFIVFKRYTLTVVDLSTDIEIHCHEGSPDDNLIHTQMTVGTQIVERTRNIKEHAINNMIKMNGVMLYEK